MQAAHSDSYLLVINQEPNHCAARPYRWTLEEQYRYCVFCCVYLTIIDFVSAGHNRVHTEGADAARCFIVSVGVAAAVNRLIFAMSHLFERNLSCVFFFYLFLR